jgi:hypothetical protein
MGNTWVVDLQHFLHASGTLTPDLPPRARLAAEFWTQIVSQATLFDEPTTILCRRRPQRRPCAAQLYLTFDDTMEAVLWCCPSCHDNGAIRGWQGTFWDHSELTEQLS